MLGLVGPVSVYCDWVRWKVWSATSISVWQHIKLCEQIRPWDTPHVAGTLSNQQINISMLMMPHINRCNRITRKPKHLGSASRNPQQKIAWPMSFKAVTRHEHAKVLISMKLYSSAFSIWVLLVVCLILVFLCLLFCGFLSWTNKLTSDRLLLSHVLCLCFWYYWDCFDVFLVCMCLFIFVFISFLSSALVYVFVWLFIYLHTYACLLSYQIHNALELICHSFVYHLPLFSRHQECIY